MTQAKIWAYHPASQGARALADALGIRVLARQARSRWVPPQAEKSVLLNWGNASMRDYADRGFGRATTPPEVVNSPATCNTVGNKATFFEVFEQTLNLPFWTTDIDTAEGWIDSGYELVCRHKLRGHSGAGIEIVDRGGEVPEAPLYTIYVEKTSEHRCHMVRDKDNVAHFIWQQKKRRTSCDAPDWRIRNYANGFIYAVNDVQLPEGYENIQKSLSSHDDLQYCAADVMSPSRDNKSAVRYRGSVILEINTAPGLESPTVLAHYVKHLQGVIA